MNDTKISSSAPVTLEAQPKPQSAPAAPSAPGPGDSRNSAPNAAPPPRRPLITYQSTLRSTAAPDPDRHQRKCSICRRADRDEIEQAFLHWRSASVIELDYRVSERALYRHAHATGLYARRKRNLRFILENVLERHDEARITLDSLLRALRAYTLITDSGEYPERPAHVVVSSGSLYQGTSPGLSLNPSPAGSATTLGMRLSRRRESPRKHASVKTATTLRKTAAGSRPASGSNRQRQSIRNRPNSLKTKHRRRF